MGRMTGLLSSYVRGVLCNQYDKSWASKLDGVLNLKRYNRPELQKVDE